MRREVQCVAMWHGVVVIVNIVVVKAKLSLELPLSLCLLQARHLHPLRVTLGHLRNRAALLRSRGGRGTPPAQC